MNFPNWIRTSFLVLLTLPVSICLVLGAIPLATVWIDTNLAEGALSPFVLQFSSSSALTILSTVSSASMSALTLAYSISLLVYVLAAGNIGPRLLQRFTGDTVTQFTAGVLGGTFLYSLHAQLYVQAEFIPKLTIAGAGFLAVLSVIQLIYFVRHVAISIFIDNEISDITTNLEESLNDLHEASTDEEIPGDKEFKHAVLAESSGYVGDINYSAIVDIAGENDCQIRIDKYSGQFVHAEEEIVRFTKKLSKSVGSDLLEHITIASSRSVDDRVKFSIRLLVEIALRALSPGVNDTYTAVAVSEGLTKAFTRLTHNEKMIEVYRDEDENVRLFAAKGSIGSILGDAYHPLRAASGDNILMAKALAASYRRLSIECSSQMKKVLEEHSDLLVREVEKGNHLKEDVERIRSIVPYNGSSK